jgi:hypothetical protein
MDTVGVTVCRGDTSGAGCRLAAEAGGACRARPRRGAAVWSAGRPPGPVPDGSCWLADAVDRIAVQFGLRKCPEYEPNPNC